MACGLLHAITCSRFVDTFDLLNDALPLLSKFSFQKEDIDLCVIKPVVNATLASLKLLCNKPGAYLKQLDETTSTLTTEFGLKVSHSVRQQFQEKIQEKYIDRLVETLRRG